MSTIQELLERKSSGSGLETVITAIGIRHADYSTPFYLQKLALTSPISGDRLIGIVRPRTQATEFLCLLYLKFSQL
jgi:hypothetical protein